MGKCVVCGNYAEKDSNLSIHGWPQDELTVKEWLNHLGISAGEMKITPRSLICSNHFDEDAFYLRKYLRDDAVPKRYKKVLPETSFQREEFVARSSPPRSPRSSSATLTATSPQSSCSTITASEGPISYSKTSSSTRTASEVASSIASLEGSPLKRSSQALMESSPSSSSTRTASEVASSIGSLDGSPLKSSQVLMESEPSSSSTRTASEVAHSISSPESPPRKKRKFFVGDISSSDFSSPNAKQYWRLAKSTIAKQRSKISNLQRTKRRLRDRVTNFSSLLKHLRDNKFLSDRAQEIVQESVPTHAKGLFNRMLKGPSRQKYDPDLRTFALSLNFYSPKAYNYVRSKFNKSLPHPSTISKWYRTIDGAPGFTHEALVALKTKVLQTNYKIICSLVMDEVAIRKQIEWDGKQFHGYVDFGARMNSDQAPEATEALVFMLVGLNTEWKLPIGYFLIHGLNGSEKATLVNQALSFIHESGVVVSNLTFDGAPSNVAMATHLGADFSNLTSIKSYFDHPVTKKKIFIFFDPSHMLKLVRNCFGEYKKLEVAGNTIDWRYLDDLMKVQDTQGLRAANKITKRHINWTREKMKVKLATQLFSKSTADALGYLREDIEEEYIKDIFKDSLQTEIFLKLFNDCFDIFNSCGRFSKYEYKQAFSLNTEERFLKKFEELKELIFTLKYQGKSILNTGRKTGFLGFLINMESLTSLHQEYIKSETPLLKYILTYKLSQDHLEIFFSALRSRFGNNNNPTAKQLKSAYKKLLVHIEIKGADSGNAVAIDSTSILHCGSSRSSITKDENGDDLLDSKEYKIISRHIEDLDFINSSAWHLTSYCSDIVRYIAGYVSKSLEKCISCKKCKSMLQADETISLLQKRKTYWYTTMYNASNFVSELCIVAERSFRVINAEISIFNQNIKKLQDLLIISALRRLDSSIFNYFGEHIFDEGPLSNHFLEFIKIILKKYFNIRIHHETFKKLDSSIQNRVRSQLTKSITFQNQ